MVGNLMSEKREYTCPRGHTFQTDSPMILAVDEEPEYNSGVICPYCYVDWFQLNVNAEELGE